MDPIHIRPATEADWPAIWPIFQAVVAADDTYAFDPDISEAAVRTAWFSPTARVYVAVDSGRVIGTFILRPNQPGPGDYVANAAIMVDSAARGQGIGRLMGEYAQMEAARQGYAAMQFNAVVSTNEVAVHLWQRLGFAIVGRVPRGFRHRTLGEIDLLVMHRFLDAVLFSSVMPAQASIQSHPTTMAWGRITGTPACAGGDRPRRGCPARTAG